MKLIYRGAEAELYESEFLGLPTVTKKRVPKPYKHKQIDESLRLQRTKGEARMLARARAAVRTPRVLDVDADTIVMERIEGTTAKERFYAKDTKSAKGIGRAIRLMHDAGIIHNDLTTSNILVPGPAFVDFGLAFVSNAVEDKGTDLIVFKKMLASTHYDVFDQVWGKVLEGYAPDKAITKKMEEVERRVKYR
jgi:Kae1-associated kinase Bud32